MTNINWKKVWKKYDLREIRLMDFQKVLVQLLVESQLRRKKKPNLVPIPRGITYIKPVVTRGIFIKDLLSEKKKPKRGKK